MTPTQSATVSRNAQVPAQAWLVVALLCVVGLLNYLDRVMITTMRGSIVDAIPMTDTQFGLLTAVFLWTYGLLSPMAGFLADRWSRTNGRARLLLPAIGLLIAAPSVFVASETSLLPVAVVGFVIYALTRMFSDANMMPILCLITDSRYRATGYGILNLFSCIVGGIGIYAGGLLRDRHIDVSILFQVAAGLMLVCAGILFSIRTKPEGIG